jgi:EpsI family protein
MAIAAIVTAAPWYAEVLGADQRDDSVSLQTLRPSGSWVPVQVAEPLLRPHFVGARGILEQTFERDGLRVGVYIGYYTHQRQGAELISFQNALVTVNDRHAKQLEQRLVEQALARSAAVQTRISTATGEMTTWHVYWVGGSWTTRPQIVKLRQAVDKLMGRGDDAAVVVVMAQSKSERASSDVVLRSFIADMGGSIEAALLQARETVKAGADSASILQSDSHS